MSLETEIPELLFSEMKNFIESSSDFDRQSFINPALRIFYCRMDVKLNNLKKVIQNIFLIILLKFNCFNHLSNE